MPEGIRFGTAQGRWVILAAVLGSGVVFLDGTVVNVALPAISEDLGASVRGLQWMLDGYLVTLSALLLLGGSAGDRYGRRRVFVAGLAGFVAASVLCGLVAGIGSGSDLARSLDHGYPAALRLSAAVCAAGGAISWLLVREAAPVRAITHPDPRHACHDESVHTESAA